MTAFKVISAVAITSLVLPQRSFVEAVPRPSPESPSGETGSQVNQATAGSIGQVALQHPQLGLDTLPETGLGIVGNITTGASDAESTAGSMTTAQLAQALNLTSHWVAPFPPLGSSVKAFDFLVDKWQLWHNRLYGGEEENLHFVNDPFTSSNNASSNSSGFSTADSRAATSVLKVDYQTGTYRQGGANSSGGSTFFPYPMELQTLSPTSMKKSLLLKYDVSFDYNFDFVKGGKLPGIFYGSEERDCSGGNLSNDGECFSVRMMWRDNGLGEGKSKFLITSLFYLELAY